MEILLRPVRYNSHGVSPGTRSEVRIGRATPRVPKLGVHLSNWIAGLIILIFACEGAFNGFQISAYRPGETERGFACHLLEIFWLLGVNVRQIAFSNMEIMIDAHS